MIRYLVVLLIMLQPVLAYGAAAPVILPVNGTVVSDGIPANGTVPVRFQLVDKKGTVLWQSHETEPVQLVVRNGKYSVDLGDRTVNNMRVLTPDVLNKSGACYLRVIGQSKKKRIAEDVEVPEKTRTYLNVPPVVREPQGTFRRSAALTLGRSEL